MSSGFPLISPLQQVVTTTILSYIITEMMRMHSNSRHRHLARQRRRREGCCTTNKNKSTSHRSLKSSSSSSRTCSILGLLLLISYSLLANVKIARDASRSLLAYTNNDKLSDPPPSSSSIHQSNIKVFFNVYANPADAASRRRAKEYVDEQMALLIPEHHVLARTIGAQLEIENATHVQHEEEGTEMGTLKLLWDYCQKEDLPHGEIVVYLHNKGSFHPSKKNDLLRKWLTRAALSKECSSMPSSCNVCSYRMSPLPHPHTSGNMWAAKCEYIKQLIDPTEFGVRMDQLYNNGEKAEGEGDPGIGTGRFAAEHWVCSHPRVQPCDLSTSDYAWAYDGLQEVDKLKLEAAPRYGWDKLSKGLSRHDPRFGFDHRVAEYKFLYNETPPVSWFGWDFYRNDVSIIKSHDGGSSASWRNFLRRPSRLSEEEQLPRVGSWASWTSFLWRSSRRAVYKAMLIAGQSKCWCVDCEESEDDVCGGLWRGNHYPRRKSTPSSAMGEKKIHIVVSHCKASLNWMPSYLGDLSTNVNSIHILSKCGQDVEGAPENAKIQVIPNVGRNDHTFAYYITSILPKLSTDDDAIVVFLKDTMMQTVHQGGEYRRTDLKSLIHLASSSNGFACGLNIVGEETWISAYHDTATLFKFHMNMKDGYRKGGRDYNHTAVSVPFHSNKYRKLGDFFNSLNAKPFPAIVQVCYGGMFAASATNIFKQGAHVWSVVESSLTRGDNIVEGHYVERLWGPLLATPLESFQVEALRRFSTGVYNNPGKRHGALMREEEEDDDDEYDDDEYDDDDEED
jgi:hypothetical protein